MLKIGEFSKLSRISIRMLRHYDDVGLLVPQEVDRFTGYRYYTEEQLLIANRIVALRDMGFSIAILAEVLNRYHDALALTEFLSIKKLEIQTTMEEYEQKMLFLDTAIERIRKDESAMNYDITIKTLPERYVASVRKIIPSYEQEGELWNVLMGETANQNMKIAEPCYGLAVFHDEGHKDENPDVEIQISVIGSYNDTENVKFKTVPSVEFASAIIKGAYDGLTSAHRTVAKWVRDNEYEFGEKMFCIYHVSPANTNNPDEYITEVCYPIKKRK